MWINYLFFLLKLIGLQPEEMTVLRNQNRQLQIDIDCTLKETDLLQSRGTHSHTHKSSKKHECTFLHKPLKCASDLFESIDLERTKPQSRLSWAWNDGWWSVTVHTDGSENDCLVWSIQTASQCWTLTRVSVQRFWLTRSTLDFRTDKAISCDHMWKSVAGFYQWKYSTWKSFHGSRIKSGNNFPGINPMPLMFWAFILLENKSLSSVVSYSS